MNIKAEQLPDLLSAGKAAELADMFRLMGDQTRLQIILICARKPTCVTDIADHLGLAQSLVSHHLRLLRAGRVLRAERRGKQMFYSLADAHISCVVADMVEHVIEPHIAVETNSLNVIVEMIQIGSRATVLPSSIVRNQCGLYFISMNPDLPRKAVTVFTRKHSYNIAACVAFTDMAKDWAERRTQEVPPRRRVPCPLQETKIPRASG